MKSLATGRTYLMKRLQAEMVTPVGKMSLVK